MIKMTLMKCLKRTKFMSSRPFWKRPWPLAHQGWALWPPTSPGIQAGLQELVLLSLICLLWWPQVKTSLWGIKPGKCLWVAIIIHQGLRGLLLEAEDLSDPKFGKNWKNGHFFYSVNITKKLWRKEANFPYLVYMKWCLNWPPNLKTKQEHVIQKRSMYYQCIFYCS